MPIVKTETVYIGNLSALKFKKVIKMDSKTGVFSIELPDYMNNVIGYQIVEADTLSNVEGKFRKAQSEYLAASSQTRKVILYDIQVNATIASDSNVLLSKNEVCFTKGIVVAVFAAVYVETVSTLEGGRKNYIYEFQRSGLPESMQNFGGAHITRRDTKPYPRLLEWTPEREQFFVKIGRAMEQVILQLEKLQNPENAAQIADSGQKLLS